MYLFLLITEYIFLSYFILVFIKILIQIVQYFVVLMVFEKLLLALHYKHLVIDNNMKVATGLARRVSCYKLRYVTETESKYWLLPQVLG